MVLRSDSERFSKELAAAGKSSEQDVIERYRLLVHEREEVGGHSVPCNSVNSFSLQFSDAMSELERVADKVKEDARADVQRRRIERCVIGTYPRANQLTPL